MAGAVTKRRGANLPRQDQKQLQRIMKILQVDETQAQEILECDKAIDRGERVYFDLPPEQEKQAKKWANATEHKRVKRDYSRKPDEQKIQLVQDVAEMLTKNGVAATITNPNRQITFEIGGNMYEWTLTKKRVKG